MNSGSDRHFTEKDTDEALIAAIKSGNMKAGSFLLRRYLPLITRIAGGFSGAKIESDDLVQEGLLTVLSAAYAYDPDRAASFKTYLSSAVLNKMRTLLKRSAAGKNALLNDYISLDDIEIPGGTDPEKEVLDDEAQFKVYALFETLLTPLERRVLQCHLLGMNYGEIALSLGIPPKSADNALSRARAKLKKALGPSGLNSGS